MVDPELDSVANQNDYVQTAVAQRWALSHMYLNQWNAELLSGFDQFAKMSQFAGLWRSFTCGYLEHLLKVEYPHSNLPMVIYENPAQTPNATATLQKHYTYIGVAYWKKLPELAPGLFRIPSRPITRPSPRSIFSFPGNAWSGWQRDRTAAARRDRRWVACRAKSPIRPRPARQAIAAVGVLR